jgi:hypothetical protein
MKVLRTLGIALVVLLAWSRAARSQSWQPMQHQPIFSASTALLLTDGTVMVHVTGLQAWWRLTPDINGSYLAGTWSRLASMPPGYSPLYYASAVLPDGRVIIEGGEYNLGQAAWTNLGAIYDPITKKWKSVAPPSGWANIGDAQSVILRNGQFMLANCCSTQAALLDPTTLTWTATGTGKADGNDEEGWTLLVDGTVLTVDANNPGDLTHSERYSARLGRWRSAGSTIVKLADINSDGSGSHEVGPAVLRPDGTVFATGATGHNSIYHPGNPGTWVPGPDFPNIGGQLDIADGPAELLPNGNVLCAASPSVFSIPVHFFEFDGTNLIQVSDPPNAPNDSSFYGRMLMLPTGQVMFTDGSADVEIYTASGSADRAWAPTIVSAPATVSPGGSYVISGKQFNGLSQAGGYGDDAQAATNYPLVRITNQATGHVFYARTHDHSTMGVATGKHKVSTNFDVPVGVELGASSLEVVANGIASDPVAVTVQ